jgi:exodeoxyribonuclease VII small subunit
MPQGRDQTAAAPRPVPEMSFEEALAELEGIVSRLEQGKGNLADAIADYERGTALRLHCEARLGEAEARVQAIIDGPGGPSGLRDLSGGHEDMRREA